MLYFGLFNLLVALRYMASRAARNTLYPALLLCLFLFSAFRFEVGCDWSGYYNQFYAYSNYVIDDLVSVDIREPLWKGVITLLNRFDFAYPWLNVVSSAMFFLGMHALAKRQPDPLSFLVLLFPILIINMPMSGIRQGAAIGLISLAFAAFLDQRQIRFVVFTVLAATIHSSAMIFILMAPLVKGRLTRRKLILAGVLALPGLAALLSTDSADLAIERYVDTGIDAAGAAFRLILLTGTGALYFVVLRKKWAVEFPHDYKLVTVIAVVMLAMILLLPFSSVIGDRLGYYLIPIQTIIFSRIPFLSIRKSRQLWISAPYLGLILVFGVWTALSRHFAQCYLPYQSWLFGLPESARFLY
ncbi:EpsG family protein [Hoeflea sp. CAU 1731]